MTDDLEFLKRVDAHLARLREEEREKAVLYDRTIGGENAPRPTPDFIEKCVGPMKSEEELRMAATAEAERERRIGQQSVIRAELDRRRAFLEKQRHLDSQQRGFDRGDEIER